MIISNHGGRSADYAPAPIDVLTELRWYAPETFDKVDVMIDGGVRSGADVVKALALGAKAVGLGRPFLYANGTHGQAGAERVCESKYDWGSKSGFATNDQFSRRRSRTRCGIVARRLLTSSPRVSSDPMGLGSVGTSPSGITLATQSRTMQCMIWSSYAPFMSRLSSDSAHCRSVMAAFRTH